MNRQALFTESQWLEAAQRGVVVPLEQGDCKRGKKGERYAPVGLDYVHLYDKSWAVFLKA